MTDAPGRGTNPFDPTAERTSELKPGEDDLVRSKKPGQDETPRHYDEPPAANEAVMPADDSTLETQI
jgi:hypothetical protein